MANGYFTGIDIGSATTKTVIIDDSEKIVGSSLVKTGIYYDKAARESFHRALDSASISEGSITRSVTTGYGRENTPLSDHAITEISCISKGAYHYFPRAICIVDIGGQDNKMIHLDADGKKIDFQMNRKCAAGTGTFLEDIANRLDMHIDNLQKLARKSSAKIELGSYCTVFSFSEILTHLRSGVTLEDLARGVLRSIVKRIIDLGVYGTELVLTGGVIEHNVIIAEMLQEEFDVDVLIPPQPQQVCALGAALYSRDMQADA